MPSEKPHVNNFVPFTLVWVCLDFHGGPAEPRWHWVESGRAALLRLYGTCVGGSSRVLYEAGRMMVLESTYTIEVKCDNTIQPDFVDAE